jgi:hypothetical protein
MDRGMKRILRAWRFLTNSWLGQVLVVVHFILVVYALAAKPPLSSDFREGINNCYTIPVAGRALQIPYEMALLKTIGWLDIPALFIFYILSLFLNLIFAHASIYILSWVTAAFLLVITSAQWWLVGFSIENVIAFTRRGRCKTKRAI